MGANNILDSFKKQFLNFQKRFKIFKGGKQKNPGINLFIRGIRDEYDLRDGYPFTDY